MRGAGESAGASQLPEAIALSDYLIWAVWAKVAWVLEFGWRGLNLSLTLALDFLDLFQAIAPVLQRLSF